MTAMSAYATCFGCDCYVKRHDLRCPFCGIALQSHTSRARWVALSVVSLAGAACADTPTRDTDASSVDATFQAESGLDARISSRPECAQGFFACGDGGLLCDRSSEFCVDQYAYGGPWCHTYSEGSWASGFDAGCTRCPSCGDAHDGSVPECIASSWNTCANPHSSAATSCTQDDAGSVIVKTMSCGPCYGAPPARFS